MSSLFFRRLLFRIKDYLLYLHRIEEFIALNRLTQRHHLLCHKTANFSMRLLLGSIGDWLLLKHVLLFLK